MVISSLPDRLAAANSAAPIAFNDLAAQQARIRGRLDRAIARVLDHGQYIMGPEVAELERRLCQFTGAPYAISCASGTDALLIALMALGVGRGDAVLCPAFTFTATPEAVALLGATPVFVDVTPETFNLAPEGIAGGVETARAHGLRTVGVIAVDLFGLPADYARLAPLAQEHGLFVLADAAQSLGAAQGERRVGTFGTVTATSFFPAKPLGCYGDGGAIFTSDADLAQRMESIRLHGKAMGADKYAIERIGVNGRLDTLQAAILIEKLAVFKEEIELRRRVAARYAEGLGDAVMTPKVPLGWQSVWAQYTIRAPAKFRNKLAADLKTNGIPTAVYYPRPLHHQAAYRGYPVSKEGVPISERLSLEVLSLPMHPYLEPPQQHRIIDAIVKSMRRSPG
jgi:dTDP-4-amino-4,6-dideoxygalactose transaminase